MDSENANQSSDLYDLPSKLSGDLVVLYKFVAKQPSYARFIASRISILDRTSFETKVDRIEHMLANLESRGYLGSMYIGGSHKTELLPPYLRNRVYYSKIHKIIFVRIMESEITRLELELPKIKSLLRREAAEVYINRMKEALKEVQAL